MSPKLVKTKASVSRKNRRLQSLINKRCFLCGRGTWWKGRSSESVSEKQAPLHGFVSLQRRCFERKQEICRPVKGPEATGATRRSWNSNQNKSSWKSTLLKPRIRFWDTEHRSLWPSSWSRKSLDFRKKEQKTERKNERQNERKRQWKSKWKKEHYLCSQQTTTNLECLRNVTLCQHGPQSDSSTVHGPKCRPLVYWTVHQHSQRGWRMSSQQRRRRRKWLQQHHERVHRRNGGPQLYKYFY